MLSEPVACAAAVDVNEAVRVHVAHAYTYRMLPLQLCGSMHVLSA